MKNIDFLRQINRMPLIYIKKGGSLQGFGYIEKEHDHRWRHGKEIFTHSTRPKTINLVCLWTQIQISDILLLHRECSQAIETISELLSFLYVSVSEFILSELKVGANFLEVKIACDHGWSWFESRLALNSDLAIIWKDVRDFGTNGILFLCFDLESKYFWQQNGKIKLLLYFKYNNFDHIAFIWVLKYRQTNSKLIIQKVCIDCKKLGFL